MIDFYLNRLPPLAVELRCPRALVRVSRAFADGPWERRMAAMVHSKLQRLAFTLVELLVAMAVIGVLVGLLLPAVQAARSSARKASCMNNLRQVGLALFAYHQSHKTLPPGCLEWRGPGRPVSMKQIAWSAMILKYLEQQNLYEQIDFRYPFDDARNAQPASVSLGVYLCPAAVTGTPGGRGKTDYGGLYGQRITARGRSDNGVFIYDDAIRFEEIRDGLSKTICVAEDTRGPDAEWINGRNVFEQTGGVNDPNAWSGDNEIRSEHTGGAMVLFVDGHTHLISNTIDKQTLAALITRNGRDRPNGEF